MWSDGQTRRPKANPGSKPIKTTTDLFENILCLELNQLSSQYLKTNIHQSLSLASGRLPDLHRPSASDFVFFLRPRTPSRSGGSCRLVSGLHRIVRQRLSQQLLHEDSIANPTKKNKGQTDAFTRTTKAVLCTNTTQHPTEWHPHCCTAIMIIICGSTPSSFSSCSSSSC